MVIQVVSDIYKIGSGCTMIRFPRVEPGNTRLGARPALNKALAQITIFVYLIFSLNSNTHIIWIQTSMYNPRACFPPCVTNPKTSTKMAHQQQQQPLGIPTRVQVNFPVQVAQSSIIGAGRGIFAIDRDIKAGELIFSIPRGFLCVVSCHRFLNSKYSNTNETLCY